MEIVSVSRAAEAAVAAHSRMYTEPPAGLQAAIAWESGNDEITTLLVWDTPDARGDFASSGWFRCSSPARSARSTANPSVCSPCACT